jgi:hypothetical protein
MVLAEQHIGRLEIDRIVTVDSWQTFVSQPLSTLLVLLTC